MGKKTEKSREVYISRAWVRRAMKSSARRKNKRKEKIRGRRVDKSFPQRKLRQMKKKGVREREKLASLGETAKKPVVWRGGKARGCVVVEL